MSRARSKRRRLAARFYPIADRDPRKRALRKQIARFYNVPLWTVCGDWYPL